MNPTEKALQLDSSSRWEILFVNARIIPQKAF
jgi:hypothetical protein